MRYALVFALLCLAAAPPAPAAATDAPSAAQVKVMAGGCITCHGTDRTASGSIPAIAGRPADSLTPLLLAFKREAPAGTTIMDRIAKGFRDDELAQLAEYFSTIEQK